MTRLDLGLLALVLILGVGTCHQYRSRISSEAVAREREVRERSAGNGRVEAL